MIKDIIICLVILAIVTPPIIYIYKSKKKGRACIGCPHCGQCKKCSH